jgi:hypothetical protein
MKNARPKRIPRRQCRGQAMVEYSMINWVLVLGLVLLVNAPIVHPYNGLQVPGGPTGGQSVIQVFLAAYQTYYESYYFVLNAPFP